MDTDVCPNRSRGCGEGGSSPKNPGTPQRFPNKMLDRVNVSTNEAPLPAHEIVLRILIIHLFFTSKSLFRSATVRFGFVVVPYVVCTLFSQLSPIGCYPNGLPFMGSATVSSFLPVRRRLRQVSHLPLPDNHYHRPLFFEVLLLNPNPVSPAPHHLPSSRLQLSHCHSLPEAYCESVCICPKHMSLSISRDIEASLLSSQGRVCGYVIGTLLSPVPRSIRFIPLDASTFQGVSFDLRTRKQALY